MAEISVLDFPEEEDHDFASEDILTVDTFPCWSHIYESDVLPVEPSDQITEPDRTNQVTFVMDLFHQRLEQSHLLDGEDFGSESLIEPNLYSGVIEENREIGVDLGLGFGTENLWDYGNGNSDGDYSISVESAVNRNSSRALRIVEIESDPDLNLEEGIDLHLEGDDYAVDNLDDEDINIPLRWLSLELEDEPNNIDGDWEEIDDWAVEREFPRIADDPDEEESLSGLPVSASHEGMNVESVGGLENFELEILPYLPGEYQMMFGHFEDGENRHLARSPALKSVVEKLPSVAITVEDVMNDRALCAICKDHMEVNEEVKKLPCSHWYHGDCILPWLGIRNTCPVCRYELPTDDPDYEQRRARIIGEMRIMMSQLPGSPPSTNLIV